MREAGVHASGIAAGLVRRAVPEGATGRLWSQRLRLEGAEAVARFTDGPPPASGLAALAGLPAVTRHGYGAGAAWYLATLPDPDSWPPCWTASAAGRGGSRCRAGRARGGGTLRRRRCD
ncbi:beta-galactosidase trimerization domain-containing protein [Streptomyces cyanogenus]